MDSSLNQLYGGRMNNFRWAEVVSVTHVSEMITLVSVLYCTNILVVLYCKLI